MQAHFGSAVASGLRWADAWHRGRPGPGRSQYWAEYKQKQDRSFQSHNGLSIALIGRAEAAFGFKSARCGARRDLRYPALPTQYRTETAWK